MAQSLYSLLQLRAARRTTRCSRFLRAGTLCCVRHRVFDAWHFCLPHTACLSYLPRSPPHAFCRTRLPHLPPLFYWGSGGVSPRALPRHLLSLAAHGVTYRAINTVYPRFNARLPAFHAHNAPQRTLFAYPRPVYLPCHRSGFLSRLATPSLLLRTGARCGSRRERVHERTPYWPCFRWRHAFTAGGATATHPQRATERGFGTARIMRSVGRLCLRNRCRVSTNGGRSVWTL